MLLHVGRWLTGTARRRVSATPKLVAHASVLSFCSVNQSTGSISRHARLEDPLQRLACTDSFGGSIGLPSTYRRGAGKRVSWRKLRADRAAWHVGDLLLGDDRLVHGRCFSSVPG